MLQVKTGSQKPTKETTLHIYILVLSIILCFQSLTAFAEKSTLIKNVKTCFSGPFETHGNWGNFLESKKKNFNKELFNKTFTKQRFNTIKASLVCNNFRYEVDGYIVEGYYLKPRNASNKKLPVVIYNRGGNAGFGYVAFGQKLQLISDIALKGFVVIGSQYRGSSSRSISNNGHDEFGGTDINDVLKLIEIAKDIPDADTDNLGMVGWSRGVMQSYIASQSIPSLKTIVAIAGNSDVEKALVWRPSMENVYKARVPNFDENRSTELKSRSVSMWLDKIPTKMSILLIHGDKDKRVNVEQSKSLASQLKGRNHPHKLVIYPNDNHGLVKHRKEMTQEIISWLKTSLI
ncbi:S9 family peptidase [Paraglaciecola sp. L3A3]|uniref:alpha/beta hydrolase family protein n=1 Tax=Paraglaciecola sp. L3A3 TaxID=2686358 RepID=UPI00131BB769|nr:prolyl oligopeptidase family serine peptidase [Paraglaciecola sp. L3A3]